MSAPSPEESARPVPPLAEAPGISREPPGARLARGVCRALCEFGCAPLTEVTLSTGRRADVLALDGRGGILIVEVKSSLADFRSDGKWRDYLEFCDRFYFAVPVEFPREVLPDDCGLMLADPYHAEVLREAPASALAPARRKAVTLRFAQLASRRLLRLNDPASSV